MKKTSLSITIALLLASAHVSADVVKNVQQSNVKENSSTKSTDLKSSYEIVQEAKAVVAAVENSGANDFLAACQMLNKPFDTVDDQMLNGSQELQMDSGMTGTMITSLIKAQFNDEVHKFLKSIGKESNLRNYMIALPISLLDNNFKGMRRTGHYNKGGYADYISCDDIIWLPAYSIFNEKYHAICKTIEAQGGWRAHDIVLKQIALMEIEDPFSKNPVMGTKGLMGNTTWKISPSKFYNAEMDINTSAWYFFAGSRHRLINPNALRACSIVTAEAVYDAAKAIAGGASRETAYSLVANKSYFDLPDAKMTSCTVPTLVAAQKGQFTGMKCDDGFVFNPDKQEVYLRGQPWLTDVYAKGQKFSFEAGKNESSTNRKSTDTNTQRKVID